jgi:hypothetical protein
VDRRLNQGMHKVEFELRNEGKEERAWFCRVEVLEFRSEKL